VVNDPEVPVNELTIPPGVLDVMKSSIDEHVSRITRH
jgi:hypothetical protein